MCSGSTSSPRPTSCACWKWCRPTAAPDVLATGLALGRRIGKLPIVARVCDGFIGNRIFAIYRRHAEYLLEDGASPQEIDDALRAYGFAMGPFAVADMSGLDIAWAMRKRGPPAAIPANATSPSRPALRGRSAGGKAGRGWYDYDEGKATPAPEVNAIVAQERERQGIQPARFTPERIQRRILAVMANEGARVLADRISLRPSDIDLVFVNGYGFPRSRSPLRCTSRSALFSFQAAPVSAPTSSSISRLAAKPIISRKSSASGAFSTRLRRSIISSVIGSLLLGLAIRNPTLPENAR